MTKLSLQAFLAFLFVGLSVSTGYAQKAPVTKSDDFLGSVSGETYRNEFFGIELVLPKGWKVTESEELAALTQVTADVVKMRTERARKLYLEAVDKEVVLVSASKKPVGAIENAMFLMAVRKQVSPAVTASMVAEATKSLLEQSPTMKLIKDNRTETIGGRKFVLADYSMTAGSGTALIKHYTTMIDGYSVSFAFSYLVEADLVHLDKIVESIRFTPKK